MKERTGTQNRINKKLVLSKKIKIDKHLAQWTKRHQREKTGVFKSRNKVGDISTDLMEVKRTIRAYKNCNQIR